MAIKWDASDWTVYYAPSGNNSWVRPDATAYRRLKKEETLCVDMDIGGKYQTQKGGHTALTAA